MSSKIIECSNQVISFQESGIASGTLIRLAKVRNVTPISYKSEVQVHQTMLLLEGRATNACHGDFTFLKIINQIDQRTPNSFPLVLPLIVRKNKNKNKTKTTLE